MTKPNLLSAALITATLLTAPAAARQGPLSQGRIANTHITTTAHAADKPTCCRNRASDLRGVADHDVWGHWGAYYGPMVPTVP